MRDYKPRGFAAMDPAQRSELARRGGLAVSADRQHMSDIGRKGIRKMWRQWRKANKEMQGNKQ